MLSVQTAKLLVICYLLTYFFFREIICSFSTLCACLFFLNEMVRLEMETNERIYKRRSTLLLNILIGKYQFGCFFSSCVVPCVRVPFHFITYIFFKFQFLLLVFRTRLFAYYYY